VVHDLVRQIELERDFDKRETDCGPNIVAPGGKVFVESIYVVDFATRCLLNDSIEPRTPYIDEALLTSGRDDDGGTLPEPE
jgi:hypothetical protein